MSLLCKPKIAAEEIESAKKSPVLKPSTIDTMVDDGVIFPVGESEQSASHMFYNNRDGRYYRTYLDMVEAKKRLNHFFLQSRGLLDASAKFKAAATKRKNIKVRHKKKQSFTKPLRRSTRPSIPVIPPPPPALRRSPRRKPVMPSSRNNKTSDVWAIRYNELESFRIEHGHCRVPRIFSSNPSLGWCFHRKKAIFIAKGRKISSRKNGLS